MSAVKLPRSLEEKLGELAARVRRLWLVRGIGLFVLLFALVALAAVLLDAKLDLPGAGRAGLLAGWLLLTAVAAWRLVWRPWRGELPVDRLAAAIERQFPSLAERLTTLVELSHSTHPGNGSKALIAVLAKETAQRTQRLNFQRAAPTGSALRVAVLSLAITLLAVGPLLFVPGAAERVRRFLLPWYTPTVEIPFKVVVSSGNLVVKRGEGATLTGYLERLKPDAPLPDLATLVYDENGVEKKLPMAGDEKAAFHVTRPEVQAGFRYRVDAGDARSDWFTVTVVDPVELADGTSFTITPPEYARAAHPPRTTPGLQEFEAVQYSQVAFTLKLTRPATSAYFEWKPAAPGAVVQGERYTASLNADRTSGTVDMLVADNGTLTLVLVGEQNVKTTVTLATKVIVDAPPKFEKVTNVPAGSRDVRPDDRVLIDLTVSDDIGVAAALLEYTVNGGKPVVEPIPLKGVNTPKADARFPFALADKAKSGDTVKFRVRATDGRAVPEFQLKPQETVFPEKGWSTLVLNPDAKPLLDQDVAAAKDKIKERLQELVGEVNDARRAADGLAKDAAGKPNLDAGDMGALNEAKEKSAAIARALDELADGANLNPDLRPLAAELRRAADQTVREAERQLKQAGNQPDPGERDKNLQAASKKLAEAADRLNELMAKNERAARDRLDRDKLERLAAEQRKLAEEAAKAGDDPAKAADLARRQKQLKDELDQLLANNPTLKEAAEAAAAEQAKELAAEAKALADEAKRVDRARDDLDAAARKRAMDAAARRQKELNDKAADLARKTDGPAQQTDGPPLDKQPFEQAAEQMAKGDAVGAMTAQEKAARELDRLADALNRAAAARRDPKEAAKQLARAEDELRKKFAEATKDAPFDQLPDQLQKKLAADQKVIGGAIERLSTPAGDPGAEAAKKRAAEKLAAAEQAMREGTARADEAMAEAAAAVRQLSDAMPNREQRLRKSAEQLERLQREQEAVRQEAEDKLRGSEKKPADAAARQEAAEKLAEAAKKQAEIADKLDDLDAPGLEARRDRAADAARRAADDLKAGRGQDVPAGQSEARRAIDQLKQAADGQTPADVQADELARQQRALADRAAAPNPSREQLQQMGELQREIAGKAGTIKDPDAALSLSRAKDAAKAAAAAAERQDVDELRKKSKEAVDELDRVADDLAGAEGDAARIERLAKERQQAAEQAQKGAGKPSSAEESAAAHADLERQADELRRSRAGDAQAAKKKAADALDKLRKPTNPEKAVPLQKQAAEAMKELSEAVAGKGEPGRDRGDPDAQQKPDDANGQLPSQDDAAAAKKLAGQQRQSRDQLAKDNEQAAQGPKPGDRSELGKLAAEEQGLAEQAAKAGSPEAAAAAKEAAAELKAGSAERAQAAGERARQAMEKSAKEAGNTPAGKASEALAKKQGELKDRMAKAAGDESAAAAQQAERQKELAQDAGKLADKLDQAAEQPGQGGKAEGQKQAADAAREAGRQMDRAAREGEAGRGPSAGDARDKANEAADRAQGQAELAAGGKPGEGKPGEGKPDPSAKEAGQAAQDAGKAMDRAGGKLGQKDGKAAGQDMKQAADKLDQAAEKMGGKPGEPGQPGQPGGDKPAHAGGGEKPATTDLPGDLAQHLGQPWGELPGEVRAKIIQDLQAKYGEDYARVIKLYFEQLAEKK